MNESLFSWYTELLIRILLKNCLVLVCIGKETDLFYLWDRRSDGVKKPFPCLACVFEELLQSAASPPHAQGPSPSTLPEEADRRDVWH